MVSSLLQFCNLLSHRHRRPIHFQPALLLPVRLPLASASQTAARHSPVISGNLRQVATSFLLRAHNQYGGRSVLRHAASQASLRACTVSPPTLRSSECFERQVSRFSPLGVRCFGRYNVHPVVCRCQTPCTPPWRQDRPS